MTLDNINWLAVIVVSIIGFGIGGTLFGPKTLYPIWTKAMGRTEEQQREMGKNMNMGLVFGLTFVGTFVQALLLAILINGLGGVVPALVIAIGVMASTTLSHRLFGGHGYKTWFIEVGADTVALVVMAIILGLWR